MIFRQKRRGGEAVSLSGVYTEKLSMQNNICKGPEAEDGASNRREGNRI